MTTTPAMSDEEERAAFELACDSQFLGVRRHPELPDQYQSWDMQCKWMGWQAAKADERTRQSTLAGEPSEDRVENAERAVLACPISTNDWNYAIPIAKRVLSADDEWRATYQSRPSSGEPSEQDIEQTDKDYRVENALQAMSEAHDSMGHRLCAAFAHLDANFGTPDEWNERLRKEYQPADAQGLVQAARKAAVYLRGLPINSNAWMQDAWHHAADIENTLAKMGEQP